jgi:hypothetical protein
MRCSGCAIAGPTTEEQQSAATHCRVADQSRVNNPEIPGGQQDLGRLRMCSTLPSTMVKALYNAASTILEK